MDKELVGSEMRVCSLCGYKDIEDNLPFGHDDFYCPKCGVESLVINRPEQEPSVMSEDFLRRI